MSNPMYGGTCSRCGKLFDSYEPSTMCMSCVIERERNRAKVWRCPVKRKDHVRAK